MTELLGGALLGLAVAGLGLGRVWGVFLALGTGTALVAAGGALLPAGLIALATFALLLPLLLRTEAVGTLVLGLALAGLGLWAGCLSAGPEPDVTARPEPLVRTVSAPPEPLPWREEVATRRVCTRSRRPTHSGAGPRYVRKIVFDFNDLEVAPLAHGPELRLRSSARHPRSLAQVLDAIEQREPALKRCYRWARFRRPGLRGVVTVRMAIDHLGMAHDLRAESGLSPGPSGESHSEERSGAHPWARAESGLSPGPSGGSPSEERSGATSTPPVGELAVCVADVLYGLQVAPYPFREARVVLPIRFSPSGQGRPSRPPVRPPAGKRGVRPAGCVDLPLLPPDQLQAAYPVLALDDFDAAQEREDRDRRALEAWVAGGRVGRRPVRSPWIVQGAVSCHCVSLSKDAVRQALAWNMGAYQRCYRGALQRRPGLAGRVTIQVAFDELGTASSSVVQLSSVGDQRIEQCLRRAVAQVRIVPPRQPTIVVATVSLLLQPTVPAVPPLADRVTASALERAAAARLEAGDGRSAARLYRALLRQLPRHPHGCSWQAGLADARWRMAPWSDRYVEQEMVALGRRLARPGCDEEARALLFSWASEPHRQHQSLIKPSLLELAIARYRRLLAVQPLDDRLRFVLAEALFRLHHYGEAGREYLQVAVAGGKDAGEAAYAALLCARLIMER